MALSAEDVRKVARLARLKVSGGELARFQGQLERVLEHMADLGGLSLDDVAPTAHALGLTNVLREDVPADASVAAREALMANFPEREGPYLKVPKVIE
ncbi:MAG: Asp-tRNA(Asn)/Glu-tRNA(Gln) amidotransferase subunit GatC [Elusimicrobia bacterium]|nr:Asp-tRNA(Asn)/Glu-tRNA(Gln) amidotransferase subunit GatC [Elusimicrobiota bacterium]